MNLRLLNARDSHRIEEQEIIQSRGLARELDIFLSHVRGQQALAKEMVLMMFLGSHIKRKDYQEFLFLMIPGNRLPSVRLVILALVKVYHQAFPVDKHRLLIKGFKI